jgi:transposase IS116/IS110/IS902 family protein
MAISLDEIHVPAYNAYAASDLRLLYQLFEEAQRSRIAHGERLRAILQGRSLTQIVTSIGDADPSLKAIARGETAGAPRILERAYARAVDDEAYAEEALRESIERHPAWPWLTNIRGIGHLLAARLLSRLDVTRAKTPSAFWAYCGLGTIPGVAYRCSRCRLEVAYPLGYQALGGHRTRDGRRECSGELETVPDKQTRVAPRRSKLGGRASYDAQARISCYLIGISMLRCRSEYRLFYDSERARLAAARPGWTPKRCHLSALRRMEKTFLRDLWVAWRGAVNLPVVPPYFPRI